MCPHYRQTLDSNISKVIRLVEKGEDINAGAYGWTPLEAAASQGNMEIVKYLLSNGAQNP